MNTLLFKLLTELKVCCDSRSVKGSEWKKSISGREGGLV